MGKRPTIRSFRDRKESAYVRKELEANLCRLCQEMGLTVKLGSMTLSSYEISGRLTIKVSNPDISERDKRERLAFEALAPDYGMKPEHFGASFEVQGQQVEVVGINPKAHVNSVIVRAIGGLKEWTMKPVHVRMYLGEE